MNGDQAESILEVLGRIADALETLASTVREGESAQSWTDANGRNRTSAETVSFVRTGPGEWE